MMKLRLMPLVMVASLTLLGSKLVSLGFDSGPVLFASPALAKEKADTGNEHKGAEVSVANVPSPESGPESGPKSGPVSGDSDIPAPLGGNERLSAAVGLASPAEYAILQDLAARRRQLDDRERGMMLRAQMIGVAEKRLDDRIQELKRIERAVASALRQIDKEEERQILSLVKVYESMKPKNAAQIFEELEMETLIEVASRMREAKIAVVLAKMSPEAAKILTEVMATRVERPSLSAPIPREEGPQG